MKNDLWDKIRRFPLDDGALPFSERLARENGWEAMYTQRAIMEYKCFMA
jgi:hypothetical protein